MQADNPFDKKLDLNPNMPPDYRAALTEVTDTLDFSWAAAQAVFEGQATPEHALKICELVMQERTRIQDRDRAPYISGSKG